MRLIHLIYLEHQGEEEEDWAYDEESAVEEVATNFFLERVLHFPNQASPQQVDEEVTSSEPREVNRIKTFLI